MKAARRGKKSDIRHPFYGSGLPADELTVWFEAVTPSRGLELDDSGWIEEMDAHALRIVFHAPEEVDDDEHAGSAWRAARRRFERGALRLNEVSPIAFVVATPVAEMDALDALHTSSLRMLERDAMAVAERVVEAPSLSYTTLTALVTRGA